MSILLAALRPTFHFSAAFSPIQIFELESWTPATWIDCSRQKLLKCGVKMRRSQPSLLDFLQCWIQHRQSPAMETYPRILPTQRIAGLPRRIGSERQESKGWGKKKLSATLASQRAAIFL